MDSMRNTGVTFRLKWHEITFIAANRTNEPQQLTLDNVHKGNFGRW